jgi:hypothetical protein
MALTDNLVSYWKFDEASGNAADAVGSNTLTNNNTTPYVAGKINNGADLERGSSQDFSVASPTGTRFTGSFSVAIWVKPESITNDMGILGDNDRGAPKGYMIRYVTGSDQLQFTYSNAGVDYATVKTAMLANATWAFIVGTHDAATDTDVLYVNGTAQTTNTSRTVDPQASTIDFKIGNINTDRFDGVVDACGLWSRALTAAEVTTLYNSGTGVQHPFDLSYTMTADQGSYTLTGQDVTFSLATSMVATVGTYVMTGFDVLMRVTGWQNQSKNTATFTNQAKNSASWANQDKN